MNERDGVERESKINLLFTLHDEIDCLREEQWGVHPRDLL